MTNLDKILYLNKILIDEMPRYKKQAEQFSCDYNDQRQLLRSLMNLRPAMPIKDEFLTVQDEFLSDEVSAKGVISFVDLPPTNTSDQIYLWKGDITTLEVDAIVNAANSALLGCFIPCHGCIDNAIPLSI